MSVHGVAAPPWYCRPRWLLLLAIATHLLCVLLVPRLVMSAAMHRLATVTGGDNRARLAPPTDASSRRIVMPSPDMRYALCVYDLAGGSLEILADPRWPTYWSVALYDARTDNYFSRNDRQLAGKPLHLRLVPAGASADFSTFPNAGEIVESPTRRGVVLLRLLVAGEAEGGVKVPEEVLRCVPHSGARG
jgi:uncharacterized membrane protein